MDNPMGAAGECEGMIAERHVFVEPRSPNGECRNQFRGNPHDPYGELSDQVGEKRRSVFRRSVRDLRINVPRDLLDGEENRIGHPNAIVAEDHFMDGNVKYVRSSHSAGRERRTRRSRAASVKSLG